jgi:hypothetical protein
MLWTLTLKLGMILLNTEGSFWDFYQKEDVEQLMAEYE